MAGPATKTIIVKGKRGDVFNLWANVENFPKFIEGLKSVKQKAGGESHWVADPPLGDLIEWDARTTTFEPHKRIAWNSTRGDIKTTGQVTFTELPDLETQVTLTLKHSGRGRLLEETLTKLLSNVESRLEDALRSFKAYAEENIATHAREDSRSTGATRNEKES
jgi:uncharacterized membrane protein